MINLTYGGTATNVTDYGRPATVTIPAGSLTGTVTLTVVNDAIVEGSETVDVTLASISSSSTGVSLGATLTATNTIADNDTATVTIANTTNGNEAGAVSGTLTATQTAVAAADTVINLTYGGTATNVTDYGRPATVTIPAGSLTGTVTLTVVNDAIVEGSETVDVTLASISSSSTGVSLGATLTATNTIADNDTATVTIANTTNGNEAGAVSGTLTATQTAVAAADTVINLTYGGTATNVTDYGRPATVTIPAGSLTGTVTLTVVNDAIVEGSETVDVTLASISSSSTGVSLGATLTATNTIADNDTATVTIANTTNGNEAGAVSGTLTATQTAVAAADTVINLTYGGTATSGSDYTALPLTVVIPANTSTADITIPVLQDLTVEPGETVDCGPHGSHLAMPPSQRQAPPPTPSPTMTRRQSPLPTPPMAMRRVRFPAP